MSQQSADNVQTREETTISLSDLFDILKRHIILLVIVTIVAALLVFLYCNLFIDPVYSANSKIFIVSTSGIIQISDLTLSSNIAGDYTNLLKDEYILGMVKDRLGLSYSIGQLSNMISVANTSGTHMIVITANSKNATEAADIANTLADVAREQAPLMMKVEEPRVVHYATANHNKISPHSTRNALIGAVVGFVVCYAVLFLRFFFNDSISSSDDIVHFTGLDILGEVSDRADLEKRRKYGKYGYGKYGHYGRYGHYGQTSDHYGDEVKELKPETPEEKKPDDSENQEGKQA